MATMIGTTIEWYDFLIYANVAAIVLAQQFFSPLDGTTATIVAFASAGVSFIFRPLGAIIAGYLGDRLGRRAVLVMTLWLMGSATVLIGLLPTYATIGVAAPVLLVLLRILQGVSAGGEWGGAALLAVEHAPAGKRGAYGVFPQLGAPAGMLLAIGMITVMSTALSPQAFLDWGWRVPFLLSFILIIAGALIRRQVSESPVFTQLQSKKTAVKTPLAHLFRHHWKHVVLAPLVFMASGIGGYLLVGGYITSYATSVLKLERTPVLICVTIAAASWLLFTWISGPLSDRIGRIRTYQIGYVAQIAMAFPLFAFINTGEIWLIGLACVLLSIGQGLTYGPQSALFCEMFPAKVRQSGASIAYGLGALIGGAFAPTIATWLQSSTGSTTSISLYLLIASVISITAVSLIKDRSAEPLEAPEREMAVV